MADSSPSSVQGARPITLIPVGLKEAALDSPTFRAGFTHFSEQIDLVEKWLESYIKTISRLSNEVTTIESLLNGFLSQTVPPSHLSEAVIDHDYTLLAMKRYGEGAKEFWTATISGFKKMDANMVEPIKNFLHTDLRSFRETRRNLDHSQKQLDSLQARYASQTKTKEASSLREDAFQLHEARKAYLRNSMDFSVTAPQLRLILDKMLVRVFSDQWQDLRRPQQNISSSVGKWSSDIDRVKGWSREMEHGEKAFRRELQTARKQIEENAEAAIRPSRELEDYAVGAATASASRGPSTTNLQTPGGKARPARSEKQGWLNLRTASGKPSRTIWLRRWFYVKNGIFGWLVQGSRSGGVEESERIGVLLCNIRPGNSDERRYIFEVKTKDTTIVVQAETQPELNEWLAAFEVAKQKALEDPASTESPGLGQRVRDPAFAISPPSAPEFAASAADSGMPQHPDDNVGNVGVDRSSTLPAPGLDVTISRSSFDVSSHRRYVAERDTDAVRDPASRLIQKLDLHRKPGGNVGTTAANAGSSPASPGLSGGGIASLIAASHSSMGVAPGALPTPPPPDTPIFRKTSTPVGATRDLPTSSLAPNTLANPPAPTSLSAVAVVVNGERGIGLGRADASGGMPSGIMANIWGSSNWGYLNRLQRGELKSPQAKLSYPPSPQSSPLSSSAEAELSPKNSVVVAADMGPSSTEINEYPRRSITPSSMHRKTLSLDADEKGEVVVPEYPNYYPSQLKTQDAQFRLLFPNVRREEKVVIVFKATWNPNELQEFPGRAYVTTNEIYFYSSHCGMTLISSIHLDSISEITAATGKECDFIFCHLKEAGNTSGYTRITIKTFLEPLRLLQRRLNFLVRNRGSPDAGIEQVMKTLIKMEQGDTDTSPSIDSWENISINTPADSGLTSKRRASRRDQRDLKASVFIDRGLYGDSLLQFDGAGDNTKAFKLPKQPVLYSPSGMDSLAVEKEFDVSPKALFHVMFGDKSAVWQLLYHERQAQRIKQGPWTQQDRGHLRREFEYQIEYLDIFRRVCHAKIEDHQMVDVANEHLLYVVSDRKRPWHLPYRDRFILLTKVCITHVAKSKCKLAIYVQADWTKSPPITKGLIANAALNDLKHDALDLTDVISDQVRTFASAHGRTKKAVQIFGQVGVQTQISEFARSDAPLKANLRRSSKHRSLTGLAFEYVGSMSESFVTSAMQIIFRFVRWIWKTINANTIILAIMAISLFANFIWSSRDTSIRWQEKKAQKFMTRLGIGPDMSMSKMLYLHDIDEATALDIGDSRLTGSKCRETFDNIVDYEETDSWGPVQSEPWQKASVRRIQRSKQRLGSQRHDLLVAIRMVNNIERGLTQVEWEHWLLQENTRCKQIGIMLRQLNDTESLGRKGDDSQRLLTADSDRIGVIKNWHSDYCESCYRAHRLLLGD